MNKYLVQICLKQKMPVNEPSLWGQPRKVVLIEYSSLLIKKSGGKPPASKANTPNLVIKTESKFIR